MKKLFFIALVFYGGYLSAQTVHEVRDSVKIHFRQGKTDLVPELRDNQKSLDRIADSLRMSYADSVYRLQKILVVGGASPEGSVKLNKWLSERRAGVLFDYLSRYGALPDSLKTTDFIGRDWNGLIRLVKADPEVPYKEETLELLRDIADRTRGGDAPEGDRGPERLQRLRGGVPYSYLYKKLFPELRASRLYLWYEKVWNPVAPIPQPKAEVFIPPVDTVVVHDTVYVNVPSPEKPFYMDIRTNSL